MQVNLYKRDGSAFYWMRWHDIFGKLHRKSTKTTRRRDAAKIARAKELELLKARGIEDTKNITLNDLLKEVRDDYEINGRKSKDRVKYSEKHLKKYLSNKSITEINELEISRYTNIRHNQGASNATINRELSVLKRGYNILYQKGLIHNRPTIKNLKENNIRKGFFEHWEYIKLMENASEHIKSILMFLYYTGWRLNEALTLTWDMVDVDNGIITLPPGMTKNKVGRHYYMPNNVSEMIRDLWSVHVSKVRSDIQVPKYVFTNRDYTDRIKDLRGAWKNSCERAGLQGKLIHDFRRTAARNYVRAGVPQRVAQELLGHQTASIFSRYNIVSDADMKTAAKKVTEYLNNQGENCKWSR